MAGNLMNATGVTERIFAFANALVGHFKAGLAQVNILSSMIFAGISGAAVADCAGLGAIEVKAMRNAGYKGDFAAAVTVASSVVGPLIPPSVSMVLYAFLAQQSIERMFLASLVPGIMVGISLMIYVRIRARHEDFPVQERATFREITASAKEGILALIAPAHHPVFDYVWDCNTDRSRCSGLHLLLLHRGYQQRSDIERVLPRAHG